jgi:predicted DNA-binding protein (UPF0251 family)
MLSHLFPPIVRQSFAQCGGHVPEFLRKVSAVMQYSPAVVIEFSPPADGRRETMELDGTRETTIMPPQGNHTGEVCMVDQERWAEIRRLRQDEQISIAEIGRRLDLDRKTVRRSLRQATWQPYHRAAVAETLLTAHADCVRTRAPQVNYSARILYQELRASRGYTGSYETVKRFVAPLRDVQLQADRALLRFETPPGQQSQIDWGQATVPFRAGPTIVHVFVLTLGFSRRGFYYARAFV